jgi:hypothetical protein
MAIVGFILVPQERGMGMTGTHFTVGWPLDTLWLKVGYVESGGRFGIHPGWHPLGLLNVLFWAAVFFAVRWISRHPRVPGFVLSILRVAIVVTAYISAAWLAYGVFLVGNTSLGY